MCRADIGVVGLAVMGENLIMNIESKGYRVAVYNRTVNKVSDFIQGRALGKNIIGVYSIEELINNLKKPRKILLMVKAGKPVDDFIEMVVPYLDKGDIIIDGGNSHFLDTIRRTEYIESLGMLYIGAGISGGEEGALNGPSIMPGGSSAAWPHVEPIFSAIAAKVDSEPCCMWVGNNGAGHFVKMVHNGIEYGDMQLICEIYHLMKILCKMSGDEMSSIFDRWNQGELNSYLIEITRDILRHRAEDGGLLVDKILDVSGHKGTGKWTSIESLEEGIPLTLISEAVYSRYLSARKMERAKASKVLSGPLLTFDANMDEFIEDMKNALYCSKIISYAQGFALMKSASCKYSWNLDYGKIALIWRGGCIIRSAFLKHIHEAFSKNSELDNILLDPFFRERIDAAQASWRRVVATAINNGIPVPALASAISYYDGYRSEWLPASLLQAQRDYFGAHTYERIDRKPGEVFHTNWTGEGGSTVASTYKV